MDVRLFPPVPGWNTTRGRSYVLNINSTISALKKRFIFILNRLNKSLVYTGRGKKIYLKYNSAVKYMQKENSPDSGNGQDGLILR